MVLISTHIPPPRISEGKPCLIAEAKTCSSRNICSFLSRPVFFFFGPSFIGVNVWHPLCHGSKLGCFLEEAGFKGL